MGSFGEKMQREREMRSISLDEIAESTKISARMLRALEEEEFNKLPGGIFNKGFVRAYSRYLGLDEEQAVTDYLAAESESEQKDREHATQDQAHLSDQMNSRNGNHNDNVYNIRASADSSPESQPAQAAGFMTAAVIIVIVLGIGGFAWKYIHAAGSTAKAAQVSPPVDTPISQPAQTPITPAIDSKPAPPSNTAAIEKTDSVVLQSKDIQSKNVPAVQDPTTSPELEKPMQSASEPNPAAPTKFNLEIRATDKSWVQVKSDGLLSWEGELAASSNRSFRATKELVVKLGNAGAVELSYNGKPLPRFSADTKTKTLTFTPDGLSSR